MAGVTYRVKEKHAKKFVSVAEYKGELSKATQDQLQAVAKYEAFKVFLEEVPATAKPAEIKGPQQ